MILVLERRDSSSKYKHCALETSMTRPRCMAHQIQQTTASWYLFDSTLREIGSTSIVLGHLLLEAIDKRLDEEKTHFDCFDKFYIRNFSDIWHKDYGKTQ